MRPIAIAVMLLAAAGTCWWAWGADEQPNSVWMKKKLEHSQSALRAIAMEDFDLLRASARPCGGSAISKISRDEPTPKSIARSYRFSSLPTTH